MPKRVLRAEQVLEAEYLHAFEGWSFLRLGRRYGVHHGTVLYAIQFDRRSTRKPPGFYVGKKRTRKPFEWRKSQLRYQARDEAKETGVNVEEIYYQWGVL